MRTMTSPRQSILHWALLAAGMVVLLLAPAMFCSGLWSLPLESIPATMALVAVLLATISGAASAPYSPPPRALWAVFWVLAMIKIVLVSSGFPAGAMARITPAGPTLTPTWDFEVGHPIRYREETAFRNHRDLAVPPLFINNYIAYGSGDKRRRESYAYQLALRFYVVTSRPLSLRVREETRLRINGQPWKALEAGRAFDVPAGPSPALIEIVTSRTTAQPPISPVELANGSKLPIWRVSPDGEPQHELRARAFFWVGWGWNLVFCAMTAGTWLYALHHCRANKQRRLIWASAMPFFVFVATSGFVTRGFLGAFAILENERILLWYTESIRLLHGHLPNAPGAWLFALPILILGDEPEWCLIAVSAISAGVLSAIGLLLFGSRQVH